MDLGTACIFSTPFMKNLGLYLRFYFDWPFHPISQIIQFSKPSPKEIFLYPRLPFIRAVLHDRFPCDPLRGMHSYFLIVHVIFLPFPLFAPRYVEVSEWQFGQINLRFSSELLSALPSIWSTSKGIVLF